MILRHTREEILRESIGLLCTSLHERMKQDLSRCHRLRAMESPPDEQTRVIYNLRSIIKA